MASMSSQRRDLLIRIDAETKGFEGGMQRSSAAMRTMQGELRTLESRQAKQHKAMTEVGQAGLAMGAAAAAGVALSVRAAVQWESAWAGVEKTVDGNVAQMAQLEGELRGLAKTLPVTHGELAGIAEAAGQLGIKRDAVASFSKTVVDLASTTDLSFDDAATSVAQLSNIMQLSESDFSRLGSTLVALGNNGASTESAIMAMALRLGGAGALVDATAGEVLALSSSMADLGIQSELGGGAMSRTLQDIYAAVQDGGPQLDRFAQVAGQSAEQFAASFRESPVEAVDAFVRGLGRIKDEGGNVIGTLGDLGIKGTQDTTVLLAMTGAGDGLTKSLELQREAWAANKALVKEAEQRYQTTESQLKIARNAVNDLGITLGSTLLPALAGAANGAGNLADTINGLPQPVQTLITVVGTLGATAGLLGGAALVTAPKIAALKIALIDMGMSADRAGRTMGHLGTVMKAGAIAGVVVGVALAVDQLVDSLAAPGPPLNALTDSMANFGEQGRITGELLSVVGDDFEGVGKKIKDASQNKWLTWDSVGEITTFREELDTLDEALAALVERGHGDLAAEIFGPIARDAEANGVSVETLNERFNDYGESAAGVSAESKLAGDGIAGVGDAAAGAAPKVEELSDAQKALESALSSFVDPLGAYNDMVQESAQAVADSTSDAGDSWQDYAGTAVVALDDLAAQLEADNQAHAEWKANLVKVAQTAGPEVAQILAEMGKEGVGYTAAMANGTSAEVQRMATALIENAALGGKGAGVALDNELRVMAAIAASGGKATVDQIATQLQLGTAQVAAIAAQYGETLAAGIDPVLLALGRPGILAGTSGRARHYAEGGVVSPHQYALATGGLHDDSGCIPAVDPAALVAA